MATAAKKVMRKFTLLMLTALVVMISTIGCNAMRGAGKDIEDTGRHIENAGK